jgi:HlyD family secretion protein
MTPPTNAPNPLANETAQRLGVGRPKRRLIPLILAIIAIGGLATAGVVYWRMRAEAAAQPTYETAKAVKGNLKVTITATGTIESVGSVEIGSEISGRVEEVLVKFNDVVKKGQVLAKINTEQLDAKVKEAKAQSMVSAANLASARATVEEADAKAARGKALSDKGLMSAQDLDSAVSAQKKAHASLATSQAQQAVSAASLEAAQSSLGKAIIRAPVDGVVLSRSIEPGQTVASSLQAPVLFMLAQDLTTMRLKVNIDEADVGNVRDGQEASFAVDAYPKKKFPSTVKSIKNVPTAGKDIVTYEAELSVSNDERLLRPGMTATATIVTESRAGALLVPNAALRFTPPNVSATAATGSAKKATGAFAIPGMAKAPGASRKPAGGTAPARSPDSARVWVLDKGQPAPLRVQTGITDGTNTEIAGGDLTEGADVIVDIVVAGK